MNFICFFCVRVCIFFAVLDLSHKCICIWKTFWNQKNSFAARHSFNSVLNIDLNSNLNAAFFSPSTAAGTQLNHHHQSGIPSIEIAMIGKSFFLSVDLKNFQIEIKLMEIPSVEIWFCCYFSRNIFFSFIHTLYCLIFFCMENLHSIVVYRKWW